MKLHYQSNQTGGRLLATDTSIVEADKLVKRIWDFVCTHRHDVLQPHHDECKAACIYQPQHNFEQKDGSFLIVSFFSSFDSHHPYLAILQKKMQFVIDNIPEYKGATC